MKYITLGVFFLTLIWIGADTLFGEEPEWLLISFTEGNVQVARMDGGIYSATINLPVVSGDRITTGKDGRCELQSTNGSIFRLDRDSSLDIKTLLAPSLTSSKRISTLFLSEGQLYSMIRTYNREISQLVTDRAAVLFNSNSISLVKAEGSEDTQVYCVSGKIHLKFGPAENRLKTEILEKNTGFAVTQDHHLVPAKPADQEFLIWNQTVNRNFDELHRGISKIPKQIYTYPPAVVRWAEKWSNPFGEWIYDEYLGYVWRPYTESWKYRCPFYYASYTVVKDQVYLVPQEPWGAVPANMGMWYWFPKRGWVWIPGSVFRSAPFSIDTMSLYSQIFLAYYFPIRRSHRDEYYYSEVFPPPYHSSKEKRKDMDGSKKDRILQKIFERVSLALSQGKMSVELPQDLKGTKITLLSREPSQAPVINSIPFYSVALSTAIDLAGRQIGFRDFNPDRKWAFREKQILVVDANRNRIGYIPSNQKSSFFNHTGSTGTSRGATDSNSANRSESVNSGSSNHGINRGSEVRNNTKRE